MDEETKERVAEAIEGVAENLEYIVGTQVEIQGTQVQILGELGEVRATQAAAQPALDVIEQGAADAEFEERFQARKAKERPWYSNRTIQIVAAAIIAVAALITGVAKADQVGEVVAVVVDVEAQA